MKLITGLAAALAAASSARALPSTAHCPDDYSTPKKPYLLVTGTGRTLLLDYDATGKKFEVLVNHTNATQATTWLAFQEPNHVYISDENSSWLHYYLLNLDKKTLDHQGDYNGSSGVVHLEFSKDRNYMVGAAYGSGMIDIWKFEDTKNKLRVPKHIQAIAAPTNSPPVDNRVQSSPHEAVLHPSGRHFIVNDLMSDSILVLDTHHGDGKWKVTPTAAPKGCGPRHGVFYSSEIYIVVCETSNEILIYNVEEDQYKTTLKLTRQKKNGDVPHFYSNITTPKQPLGSAAGEVVLTSDRRELYVTNRLLSNHTNSIAAFSVSVKNGLVNLASYEKDVPSWGTTPRGMSLSLDEKTLFVANQHNYHTPEGAKDYGLIALDVTHGHLAREPTAKIEASTFFKGEFGFGPAYVQQIKI